MGNVRGWILLGPWTGVPVKCVLHCLDCFCISMTDLLLHALMLHGRTTSHLISAHFVFAFLSFRIFIQRFWFFRYAMFSASCAKHSD